MRACIDWAMSRCTTQAWTPGPYCSGPGISAGKRARVLGAVARAVLDFGVGVTHHLLEHEVDKGTPLVSGAGGVGEVFAAARARFDGESPDVLAGTGVGALRIVVRGPFAPGAGTGAGGGVVGAAGRGRSSSTRTKPFHNRRAVAENRFELAEGRSPLRLGAKGEKMTGEHGSRHRGTSGFASARAGHGRKESGTAGKNGVAEGSRHQPSISVVGVNSDIDTPPIS